MSVEFDLKKKNRFITHCKMVYNNVEVVVADKLDALYNPLGIFVFVQSGIDDLRLIIVCSIAYWYDK